MQIWIGTIDGIGTLTFRRTLEIVGWQVRKNVSNLFEAVPIIATAEVRDSTLRSVSGGTSQLLLSDLLMSHRFDHIGPGDKHVTGAIDHEDEVGQSG